MNAFEGIWEDQNTAGFDVINEALKPTEDINKKITAYLAKLEKVIADYVQNGVIPDALGWNNPASVTEEKTNEERVSAKENIEPKPTVKKELASPPRQSRPRRNAFKEASQNINHQSSLSLNTKLRRPKNVEGNIQNVNAKMEKLTMESTASDVATTDAVSQQDIKVKKEKEDEMPAPSRPAPRRKKRERKIKQEKDDEDERKKKQSTLTRDSDIIAVNDATVVIVNLDSSDDDGKGAQPKTKRSRSFSSEDEICASSEKRSKSNDDKEDDEPHAANDATFVAKPVENINATIVVDHPKYPPNLIPRTTDDLMTDDESEEEAAKVKTVPKSTIPKLKKPIFSPFEQSPVKQKVQAFEKLQEEASSEMPPRTTRTKTRALAKKQQELEEQEPIRDPERTNNTNVREKAKMFTPLGTKFLPKAASTTVKTDRILSSSNVGDKSVLSAKSASALKASQAEYREREKKKREKEQEALKKRDALLQSQIEEKKRKREEKQLKAQQQREAIEKEKLKTLEVQRQKDARHKQLVAEQEERKLKQKEEHEKKRQVAKMRAAEEKRREEEKRVEEQKRIEEVAAQLAKRDKDIAQMVQKQQEHKNVPIYLRTRAPLLPTPDCYDSDDERRPERITVPAWCSHRTSLRLKLKCQSAAGERIKNAFFSIQAQTPDLQDIFENIEPKKLKRTSSAVWGKPPRFTMLPALENHDETEEFDEDFE